MQVTISKKRKAPRINLDDIQDPKKRTEKIIDRISMLNHKNLQKECILRGMEFEAVVKSGHHVLSSFLLEHYDDGQDAKLLDEYDTYIEETLIARGYKKGDAMLSPCFRMGFTGDISNIDGNKIQDPESKKSPQIPKVDRPKREKDPTTGVLSGTKKSLTYTLAKEGESLETVISKVLEQFPEAVEKSIRIWFKRALKEE